MFRYLHLSVFIYLFICLLILKECHGNLLHEHKLRESVHRRGRSPELEVMYEIKLNCLHNILIKCSQFLGNQKRKILKVLFISGTEKNELFRFSSLEWQRKSFVYRLRPEEEGGGGRESIKWGRQ